MTSDADDGASPESAPGPPPNPDSPAESVARGPRPRTENTAKAALAAALAGFIVFGGTLIGAGLGVLALALASSASRKIDESDGTTGGRGIVTASRVVGIIDIVLTVVVVVAILATD